MKGGLSCGQIFAPAAAVVSFLIRGGEDLADLTIDKPRLSSGRALIPLAKKGASSTNVATLRNHKFQEFASSTGRALIRLAESTLYFIYTLVPLGLSLHVSPLALSS